MTAPTEAEIRAYMENYRADNWTLDGDALVHYVSAAAQAFEDYTPSLPDSEYLVFSDAYDEEIAAILPAINAAVIPLVIEAQVRATVRFFEHFPNAPRAEPVPA